MELDPRQICYWNAIINSILMANLDPRKTCYHQSNFDGKIRYSYLERLDPRHICYCNTIINSTLMAKLDVYPW